MKVLKIPFFFKRKQMCISMHMNTLLWSWEIIVGTFRSVWEGCLKFLSNDIIMVENHGSTFITITMYDNF